ncbi:Mechanosensory protein 2 [Halotydeus destructor]|nr:Mechanosensory protein 2 [Halotydeus destructor]
MAGLNCLQFEFRPLDGVPCSLLTPSHAAPITHSRLDAGPGREGPQLLSPTRPWPEVGLTSGPARERPWTTLASASSVSFTEVVPRPAGLRAVGRSVCYDRASPTRVSPARTASPYRAGLYSRSCEFFSLARTQTDANPTIGDDPGLCAFLLTVMSVIVIICTLPVSLFMCVKVVQEYERAVIFRLGRLVRGGARGPGIFIIIPCIDTYCKVDLRTVSFDVPPQEILSRDSVTVAVDAVVYFRISNATAAVSNVEDYGRSTRLLAATTLRNVLGTKNLSEILSEREIISHIMQENLDEATDPWGVKVERVEIKDVRLPVQLQRAMAAEAEAVREARAKVIAAEGEQRAARALREASVVISQSPAALQLRYLQTLGSIATEKNSTIVFPVPMELFRGFTGHRSASSSTCELPPPPPPPTFGSGPEPAQPRASSSSDQYSRKRRDTSFFGLNLHMAPLRSALEPGSKNRKRNSEGSPLLPLELDDVAAIPKLEVEEDPIGTDIEESGLEGRTGQVWDSTLGRGPARSRL